MCDLWQETCFGLHAFLLPVLNPLAYPRGSRDRVTVKVGIMYTCFLSHYVHMLLSSGVWV